MASWALGLAWLCGLAAATDECAQLQLRLASNQTRLRRTASRTVVANSLYWQGYGEQLWSYFIGLLGEDTVALGGVKGSARMGLNLMGNAPLGNPYQQVTTDSGMLGLLPGCFSGDCRGSASYDDLLTSMARQGTIDRAFTMCFDDSEEGGGKLYLGSLPKRPKKVVELEMVRLDNSVGYYSMLSPLTDGKVKFYFGDQLVGTQEATEWNLNAERGASFSDTGTNGFLMPNEVLHEILSTLKKKIEGDKDCARAWGQQLMYLKVGMAYTVKVSAAAVECAKVPDVVLDLGGVEVPIKGSSFFYETEPCSNEYMISWSDSGGSNFLFGTSFNWGQTVHYDTRNLQRPKMLLLGDADGCKVDYGQEGTRPIAMKGLPGQVLGPDGTITAVLTVGTPAQEVTVQLDSGSQKFMAIHKTCRMMGDCFLVEQPYGGTIELTLGQQSDTDECQQQLADMMPPLKALGCERRGTGMVCSCEAETCLSTVLRTAAEYTVPKKICAITRAMCGEQMHFMPEFSRTFKPKHPPAFAFKKPPSKQKLTVQCNSQYLCSGSKGQEEVEHPQPDAGDKGYNGDDGGRDGNDGSRDGSREDAGDKGYNGDDGGRDGNDGSRDGSREGSDDEGDYDYDPEENYDYDREENYDYDENDYVDYDNYYDSGHQATHHKSVRKDGPRWQALAEES